ncbi:hypothetical protein ARMGADRAFT_339222 [Armillaria gallica]|uniref:Uncharacterized protein n=1 Tax=Armillaria gallica TaxID=47427 RepID=A0A2H3D6B4_ARMGA|nr:hypothetical protein ARMGADRAFT_339222 [Armillaria gallica]
MPQEAGRVRTRRGVTYRCPRVHCLNLDGRTGEGSVKTGTKHFEEVDRKIDTLINKFVCCTSNPDSITKDTPQEIFSNSKQHRTALALNMIAPVLRKTCLPTTPHQRSTVPPPRHINVSSVAVNMNNEVPLHLCVQADESCFGQGHTCSDNELCWEYSGECTGASAEC